MPVLLSELKYDLKLVVAKIREYEKNAAKLALAAGMPRREFIKSFTENSTNLSWVQNRLKGKPKYATKLKKCKAEIKRI